MNLYKSLIFILYLGIFLGSGFRTPAQSRDSITLYGTLDTVQVIRQRIQHANEANAGARVTHISPAILQANKTRSLAELLTDHTFYILNTTLSSRRSILSTITGYVSTSLTASPAAGPIRLRSI